MRRVTKAVIPAAGLGTRMLPATKAVPKELLPIVRKPAIQVIVEECAAAGIDTVVLIQGRNKGSIEDHFDVSYELEDTLRRKRKTALLDVVEPISSLVQIVSVRQQRPLGLGHAVGCARGIVGEDEPFAVILPDDLVDAQRPAIRQLIDIWDETQCGAVGLVEVPDGQQSMYGIVGGEAVDDRRYRLTELVEKPPIEEAPSNLAIVGRYVLPGEIFSYLAETRPGRGGEIQLTDAMVRVMERHGLFGHLLEGMRYDTGDVAGLIEANIGYAMKDPELAARLRAFMRPLLG